MIGTLLRHMVDQKHTSIQELETVTGRGSSTICRWLSGESQPLVEDMRRIIRGVADDTARRTIVAAMTSDLPLTVQWIGSDVPEGDANTVLDGHDVPGRTLLALECVSGLLAEEHEAMRLNEGVLPARSAFGPGAAWIQCAVLCGHLPGAGGA